ncbi:FAD-binding protein [Campylobacter geochelonis]|uniref:Putative flavocytochrome c flavin subunit n=1 Tax=Campylobacter geochelonis TaxID=1780362 RepID=A0A128EKA7_9BACT|nr:FAD-binding protein [Campylobacter geochelonis]QKF71292.1 flavocytochrome c [Campylobacter geochelonis]CZE48991.1 putative flavocytochrome c flavin subunit [Campylobacter geochelonis]CZE51089.1 putative flavocytochrome c flavin subunit [Campylobacter geochelonis]
MYDVIIVGSGLAGMCVANLLSDTGKKVAIFEKQNMLFGSSRYSTLNLATCENSLQKSLGIKDNATTFLDDMYGFSGGFGDKKLLGILAINSNLALKTLQSFGCEYKDEIFLKDYHSVARVCEPKHSAIKSILNPLHQRIINKVDIFLEQEIVDLEKNGSKIDAVILKDDTKLKAKIVVFATGGFSRDKEFIHLQNPLASFTKSQTTAQSNANSLKTLLKVGAIPVQVELMRYAFNFGIEILPYSLIIDINTGQRLCDESKTRQELAYEILHADKVSKFAKGSIALFDEYAIKTLFSKELLQSYIDKSMIKIFNNTFDIAEFFGLDNNKFDSQIKLYNSYFDSGIDTKFGKNLLNPAYKKLEKAPFYALNLEVYLNYTQGGVAINEHSQVINIKTFQPFSNLFVVGEASGGVHGMGRLNGCSSLECVVFAMQCAKKIKEILA